MPTVPTTRNAIIQAIKEEGPMSSSQLAEHLNKTALSISGAIILMRKYEMLHIVAWKRSIGTRGRWGAIYQVGKGKDIQEPKVNPKRDAQRRYAKKMKEVIRRKTNIRRGHERNIWAETLGITV